MATLAIIAMHPNILLFYAFLERSFSVKLFFYVIKCKYVTLILIHTDLFINGQRKFEIISQTIV